MEKEARMCIKSYDMLAFEHLHVHEQGAETSFGKSNRPVCRASVRCLAAGSCMVVAAIVPGDLISVNAMIHYRAQIAGAGKMNRWQRYI